MTALGVDNVPPHERAGPSASGPPPSMSSWTALQVRHWLREGATVAALLALAAERGIDRAGDERRTANPFWPTGPGLRALRDTLSPRQAVRDRGRADRQRGWAPVAETDWKRVTAHLRELSGEFTLAQRGLADALDVPLAPGTPMPVAAALLRAHLTGPLRLKRTQPIDEEEYGYLRLVAGEAAIEVPPQDLIAHRDILEAWLEVAWAQRSVIHLERLSPEPGDIAITPGERGSEKVQHDIIASISNSGRINFRGGRGRGARPHRVTSLVKQDAPHHADLVREAREEALARDPHPGRVTRRELALLRPWQVTRGPSLAEQEALRETLETATAERDLQEVLQRHPALLGHVLTGNHGTWVRPEVGFGNHYRADFLIAGRTSAGLQWVLVELESPHARLTNRGNGRESPTLRHAVDQIRDWREWLSTSLFQARAAREDNGLGLPGITADARGLIIIGREDGTEDSAQVRRRLFTDSRIEVRTFDWLLRAAEQAGSHLLDLEAGDGGDER